ncbi:hypothetical protein TARUN_357 [Trichoderma arundinaceum]|uniref:BTB domain-containing protein n=1 Tax=Trichoderma arundinaceum TaxID=490622 RepID=A0A395P0H3_TRIAR|nr:hypothetical protein TARUN_357 [Trichoderma arundinaceum]
MEPTMYMIDPRGDTLLILYNANSGDMTRDSALRWDNNLPQYLTREAQRNDMMLGILPPSAETSPGDGEREVWMRLSSKHLSLASAYFQRLISGDWTETQPKDGYSYTITAQEWDEKALVLLMNIIHGRTTHVPRCVSVEMLAKLGILVNYYKCYEAVKFYTDTWVSLLNLLPLPLVYGRELLFRLFVSWVFLDGITFATLTKVILYNSRGPMHSLGLPMSHQVIGKHRGSDASSIQVD